MHGLTFGSKVDRDGDVESTRENSQFALHSSKVAVCEEGSEQDRPHRSSNGGPSPFLSESVSNQHVMGHTSHFKFLSGIRSGKISLRNIQQADGTIIQITEHTIIIVQ